MLKVKDKSYQPLGLEDRWPWKKEGSDQYKGLRAWEVIDFDPEYAHRCTEQGLLLDDEAYQSLMTLIDLL